MKVQASSNLSSYYDTESHEMVYHVGDVIEMVIEDGVASVPKSPMLGYRPLDVSGIIVEDRVPPSPLLVSAMYEATLRLRY
ncbi:hypothetical protein LCGC14_0890730 [marine sediment metagenome]|uniref:Uncharacterized protein n=1 Tax=marine sediment metagenome TaxID=412755 RepID=A0A0F9S6A4_9ZZZZ